MATPVAAAVDPVEVTDRVCLDVGAGHGDSTAALLEAGAAHVVSVDHDPARVQALATRFEERCTPLLADLRCLPIASASVEVVLAHAVCNQFEPAALWRVAAELARVATSGATLVVDDYDPLPTDAAIRPVFALEDAATYLAMGRPAQTFYPPALVAAILVAHGWTHLAETTLLDPVPWTDAHRRAHEQAVRDAAAPLSPPLQSAIETVLEDLHVPPDRVGRLWSQRFRCTDP
ncbi:MAG: class I SAM-dependent methyltransferase [Halobacteriaceae archaeon]